MRQTGERERPGPVAQTARVMQQVVDGDRVPDVAELGDVLADVVGELDATLLHEHRDRETGELLGHGGDVEHGRGRDGHAVLETREAVALAQEHFAVAHDGDRHARRCTLRVGREQ
jgi:hypothetical protein